jgi:hypothetical protein
MRFWLALLVAQIFNLLYRRLAVGRAPDLAFVSELLEAQQIGNLRYGRLQICATSNATHNLTVESEMLTLC